jgi:hypothetical protein
MATIWKKQRGELKKLVATGKVAVEPESYEYRGKPATRHLVRPL